MQGLARLVPSHRVQTRDGLYSRGAPPHIPTHTCTLTGEENPPQTNASSRHRPCHTAASLSAPSLSSGKQGPWVSLSLRGLHRQHGAQSRPQGPEQAVAHRRGPPRDG